MTTSEGGMVTTDDERVADTIRRLRSHGERGSYEHVDLGFNYRMTNIAAAIGIEQLKRLPDLNARRIANARFFDEELAGLQTPRRRNGVTHVFHQYTLRIAARRDELMQQLRARGVESRVYYPLAIHQQPLYRKLGYEAPSLPEAERAAAEVVSVPVHPSLTQTELSQVANAVREVSAGLG
jgi:dTDP-4-amino-4,6-dideoxygalactose transaminase